MLLMNHSHKYNVGQKKSRHKNYKMCDSIYMKFKHRPSKSMGLGIKIAVTSREESGISTWEGAQRSLVEC